MFPRAVQSLYYYDQLFSHVSQPKKLLTQNVFLLHYPNFFDLILTKIFQKFEELVVIVQYLTGMRKQRTVVTVTGASTQIVKGALTSNRPPKKKWIL
jgi:hypothetical protein